MSAGPQRARFRVAPGFAVPFVYAEHPNPESLNTQLRSLFLQKAAEGEAYSNAQPTMRIEQALFESRFDLFEWPEAPVQELRNFCWSALFNTLAQVCGYSQEELAGVELRSDAWFHITRSGGYFGQHNHPGASWSGVYCVDPGEEGPEHADSGVLQFANPTGIAAAFADLGNTRWEEPWGTGPLRHRFRAGELVIFPAWVMHQVLPYLGQRERITVAFNAWFRQRTG